MIDGIRAMFQKGSQERELLDVNQLIREVLELVRGKVQKKRVLVRSDLLDEMRPVQASRIQLQQVMLNLVMNAIDAMDTVTNGARQLRVTSALRAPNDVLIAVENWGLELPRRTSTASLIPSLRRNPTAWVWAWRFVDLLSRRTVGVFPHVQFLIEVQSLRLRCQPGIREPGFRRSGGLLQCEPARCVRMIASWSGLYRPTEYKVVAFFTIGHSVRPLGLFIDLLKAAEVRVVVDVRAIPRSRTNPQYDGDTLPSSLSEFRIGYEHIAELGGRRGRQPNVPSATNAFWQNQSFHNYADYAMGDEFHAALEKLRQLGHSERSPSCAQRRVMVAMSPADHFGLSDRRRRGCLSHSRTRSRRASLHNDCCQTWPR